jgi:HEAT repeat protein
MFPALLVSLSLSAGQTAPAQDRTEKEIQRLTQVIAKGPLAEKLKAVEQLGELGPAARPAASALMKLLRDDDSVLRRRAMTALKALKPTDIGLVDSLVEALRGDDVTVQQGIGDVLAGIGPIATAQLNKLLQDNDAVARRGAANALVPFGVDGFPSVRPLKKALGDPEPGVRFAAARALVAIEPAEKASYPVLAEALLSKDALERQQAVELLAANKKQDLATPYLRKMLLSPDEALRRDALGNLRRLGAEAVPVFIEALEAKDLATRRDAADGMFDVLQNARRALARLPDDADPTEAQARLKAIEEALKKAETALGKALEDPDAELRFAAARTLYFVHRDLDKTLPIFLAALEDKDETLRRAAVKALRDIPDNSERLLKLLVAATKDAHPDVRLEALTALWVTHGESEIAQTALIDALSDASVRQNAYAMLYRLIGQGHDLSAVLIPLTKHADEKIREAGIALLKNPGVSDDKIKEVLVAALKDKSALVRLQAVQSITTGEELPEDIVGPLLGMLDDASQNVRMTTVVKLRRFPQHAGQVVPGLVRVLRDKDGFVRAAIADTLSFFRDEWAASVPGLVGALKEEDDDYVRERLVRTLALFGPDAKEAVPVLLEIIEKDLAPGPGMALLALSRIGPNAKGALPVLIDALQKNGSSKAVQEALAAIGVDAAPPLVKLLKDATPATRLGAATVLGRLGAAANAGEALEARLKDDDPMVRIAAALAHYQVTGETKAALATLTAACKTRDRRLRIQALKNLKDMGVAAAEVASMLVAQLSDPDPGIRMQVEDTLMNVDPQALERARAAM